MGILTFIVILVVLIVIHELGHFVAAKISKMRVDEFGIGYPPKLFGKKVGETEYTINALPFGGFVKIYGEDMDHTSDDSARAFSNRPRILQAFVLSAGVLMNIILGWVLIAAVLLSGAPRALTPEQVPQASDVALTITYIVPGSPADDAGFLPGDEIVSSVSTESSFEGVTADAFISHIGESEGVTVFVDVNRGGTVETIEVVPEGGIIDGQGAIGVGLAPIGVLQTGVLEALGDSFVVTLSLLRDITIGIGTLIVDAFTLSADLSQIAGPVGIAGVVADASENGLIPLLSLTALISLNLAIINLLPVPALDGGRLLFVAVESIIRRPIPAVVAQTANTIGFLLLILLMVVVTISDIGKLL